MSEKTERGPDGGPVKSDYEKKKEYIKAYYKRRYETDSAFREKENKRTAALSKKKSEDPEYRKKIYEKAKQRRDEIKSSVIKLKELEQKLLEKGITV
jgi:hypothetical protein